jgi:hypothetical protein
MTRIGSADRFGSIYTQMSREVAKWILSPDRTVVENLFEAADDEADVSARDLLQAAPVDHVDASPSQTLLRLAQQASDPNRQMVPSALPVTNQYVEMQDKACFDVFQYYLGAAEMSESYAPGSLRHASVSSPDGVETKLLEKHYGGETVMLTDETWFNGIKLPQGSLLRRFDDGYAFLRLTPFTFDRSSDREAFGSEIKKAEQYNEWVIRQGGEVALQRLIEAAV